MSEILVLVEHTEGDVKKVTLELLTKARELGEPSAVYIGSGFDKAKDSWPTTARPRSTWPTPPS